ncbi:unnamed protein product [Paramecium primaurelia]|uniref:Uncharacterized protein n=1 Tax=Paramecium primaurelia TaxID=5886 RepID=A0A8S1MV11_PARPR|nr:unnamed protein product [Paramecium primaurelia]
MIKIAIENTKLQIDKSNLNQVQLGIHEHIKQQFYFQYLMNLLTNYLLDRIKILMYINPQLNSNENDYLDHSKEITIRFEVVQYPFSQYYYQIYIINTKQFTLRIMYVILNLHYLYMKLNSQDENI